MKINGDAIYGTHASVFPKQPWGRCTLKPDGEHTLLYLHVFDWPQDGKLTVPGLANKVESASLLDGGVKLQTVSSGSTVTLSLPATAPDPISSTVVLRIEGKPKLVSTPE